jgi:hypothetical protein
MRKRTAIPLVVAALIVTAAALMWWMQPARPPTALELTFLGYTNKPLSISTALVLVTNTSRVPFEIRPWIHTRNVVETNGEFFNAPGFVTIAPVNLPRLIKPGQATVLDVWVNDFTDSWWTEVAAHPMQREVWLRRLAAGIRNQTVQGWVDRIAPPPQTLWIKLGPITNLPPQIVRVKNGWRRNRN